MRTRLFSPDSAQDEPRISIEQLRARWRLPAFIVRHELKRAGIKLVPVPRKPSQGALFRDVIALEEQVRQGIIQSGIRPNPPKDAPSLRVMPDPKEQEADKKR
jgi:hypothetical protein